MEAVVENSKVAVAGMMHQITAAPGQLPLMASYNIVAF